MKYHTAGRIGLIVVALIACAAAGYFFYARSGGSAASPSATPQTASANGNSANDFTETASSKISVSEVLRVAPQAGTAPAPATPKLSTAMSPASLTNLYLNERNDLTGLWARLNSEPANAESLGLRATILSRCAPRSEKPAPDPEARAKRRATFLAGLPPNHPDNDTRIRAYDLQNNDLCTALNLPPTTAADTNAAFATAAQAGDPVAKLRETECKVFNEKDQKEFPGSPALAEADFATIKAAFASGNPRAIELAGALFANTYKNGYIEFAPGQPPQDAFSIKYATELLVCDVGGPCNVRGRAQWGCIYEGKCAANTLAEHVQFYDASPHGSQQIEQIRIDLLRMFETKNFNALRFITRETPGGSSGRFGGSGCD